MACAFTIFRNLCRMEKLNTMARFMYCIHKQDRQPCGCLSCW